jgi:hypothetical protein
LTAVFAFDANFTEYMIKSDDTKCFQDPILHPMIPLSHDSDDHEGSF